MIAAATDSVEHRLKRGITVGLIIGFALWVCCFAVAGTILAQHFLDLSLTNRALSVGSSLHLNAQGRPHVQPELAQQPLGKLFSRKVTTYVVLDSQNRVLTGDERLPRQNTALLPTPAANATAARLDHPIVQDGRLGPIAVHIATARHLTTEPGWNTPYVTVMVAESSADRTLSTLQVFAALLVPQLAIVIVLIVYVWRVVHRISEPLYQLSKALRERSESDLSPVPETGNAPVEVESLRQAINHIFDRLSNAVEANRRFVGNVAHQLRTPLAGLLARTQVARREAEGTPVGNDLQLIESAAQRAARSVDQLLAMAYIDEQRLRAETIETMDLLTAVRNETMHWVPRSLEKKIDLGFESDAQSISIRSYLPAVQAIVGNLIDNALTYCPAESIVTVRLEERAGTAWLEVEDNGPGIPESEREHIFERFSRGRSSHGIKGSGLGLAIVREYARLLGGDIQLIKPRDSQQGTCFAVSFINALSTPMITQTA